MSKNLLIFLLISLGSACQSGKHTHTDLADATAMVPFNLDTLQERSFRYFWDLALPGNYQIPDRWPTERFSSIAATGFGLTSYLVGVERGYVSREAAAERTLQTLRVLWNLPQGADSSGVSGYKGFFYHFLTNDAALRYKNVELSTIDTGLLMAGILSAQSYFTDNNATESEIRRLADALYRRVEWNWMLNQDERISMGWRPERGYIKADWNGYNEAMILIILALGSPTYPIDDNGWERWTEDYTWAEFQGYEHLNFTPLFGHQYSHMYIDFRQIQDAYMRTHQSDYFQNSRLATLANRAYCIENPRGFVGYGKNQWGLTACDGPAHLDTVWNRARLQFFTYRARGASAEHIVDDGTLAPTAAGGSIPFAPEVCIPALEHMWTTHYDSLVGRFGFKDAFNLTFTFDGREQGWFDHDYLGIDQGPIVIQIENHRSELIWNIMKQNPYIRKGLERAGFTGGWLE